MADTRLRGKDASSSVGGGAVASAGVAKGSDEGLTRDMNQVVMAAGGRPSEEVVRVPLHEKSKMAWRFVRPYWHKTAWWVMLAISIVVMGLDIDAKFGGFIYSTIGWARKSILAEYPSVAFILGMLACYYLVLRGRSTMRNGE